MHRNIVFYLYLYIYISNPAGKIPKATSSFDFLFFHNFTESKKNRKIHASS